MYYLNDVGLLCTLGAGKSAVAGQLLPPAKAEPEPTALLSRRGRHWVGAVNAALPGLPTALAAYECRNNALAIAALEQLQPTLETIWQRYGRRRTAVVMATSTTGIDETERALKAVQAGQLPVPGYHAVRGSLGALGHVVASYLGTGGPCYTISTACSSGGNAMLSARRLLQLDLCDAVVVGGVDSLCELTLQGFGALEALSAGLSKPFTSERDGINIGEAAAIFVLSREPAAVRLLGGAASSDAYHISAPQPEGDGALAAMQQALLDARLEPAAIDYINLHGTGTAQNDAMEATAVYRLFGDSPACSSTKALTGHTLGAAATLELALCWLLLTADPGGRLPPSLYADQTDPALAPIRLAGHNDSFNRTTRTCMSNSFAFGGSNVSLIIGSGYD